MAYNAEMTSASALSGNRSLRLLLAALLFGSLIHAQENPPTNPAGDDSHPVGVPKDSSPPETPAERVKRCWQMLTDNVQDSKHFETRIQALSALSNLGSNPRANTLIAEAMKDSNLDVRTAAILAAGNSKSRTLIPPVKGLLDDHEPQVVFAAATTLWKQFKDKSGEDVLAAIAAGERKANPNLIHGAAHDMSRTMHSPSAMEKLALTTGAGMVLGPFGFSVGAVEYARKNGADSARIQAINLLAEEKTEEVRAEMKSALGDKDPGVRAAAVRILGSFHRPQDAADIAPLLDDLKLPVRLTAASAYIECLSGSAKEKTSHRSANASPR